MMTRRSDRLSQGQARTLVQHHVTVKTNDISWNAEALRDRMSLRRVEIDLIEEQNIHAVKLRGITSSQYPPVRAVVGRLGVDVRP